MSEEINRKDVSLDEKGKPIEHVKGADFIQTPNNNTDITQHKVELYYTDLDVQDDAELFTHSSDAYIKAQNMMHKFPNHIVNFYMFYYEELTPTELRSMSQQTLETRFGVSNLTEFKERFGINSSIDFTTYTKNILITRICRCIPGTARDGDERYRDVKKRNLKKLYDKIDFIQVYRPRNGIKWYTVSKDELNTELAVIKEFYGLTNFPDKVGEFYYSKKIGKWLATEELAGLLEFWGENIPVIYVDELGDGQAAAVEHKTLLQLLWEMIVNFFKGIGGIIGRIFGALFNQTKWNEIFDFDDDNIPKTIGGLIETITDNKIKLAFPIKEEYDTLNDKLDNLHNFFNSWISSIWNELKNKLSELFGWSF